MGGANSGTWYRWGAKGVTMEQKRIDIRWLNKQGYLSPDYSYCSGSLSWSCRGENSGSINFSITSGKMILTYRHREHDKDWENVEQTIQFNKTSCYFGGYRKWFFCPSCYKRVAILYGVGKYFFCRHCYNLTYQSCNEHYLQRILNKAYKLKKKLGGEAGLDSLIPDRPKWMHKKTYNRIYSEIIRLECEGETGMFNMLSLSF